MLDARSERIATAAGNLFFLAAIILFVTLILLATGTVQAQDALEPDALEPDALEPDALGLETVNLEYAPFPLEVTEGGPWAYCHQCQYWVDLTKPHQHRTLFHTWLYGWHTGRYDVPNPYWWTFGEGFFDEFGTGCVQTADASPSPKMLPGVKAVPAVVATEAPGTAVAAVQKTPRTSTERSRSVPAVIERSSGRTGGRVK